MVMNGSVGLGNYWFEDISRRPSSELFTRAEANARSLAPVELSPAETNA